jgi:hypothetical protein
MSNRRPFIVATFAFLFMVQMAIVVMGASQGARGRADLRQLYAAGYMVRTGHGAELYDYDATLRFQNQLVNSQDVALPFNHLAFESLIYLPLTYFKFRTAYFVFMALNVGLLVLAAWLAQPYLDHLRAEWRWMPIAIFACFLPVAVTLIQGQDSIILLLLMIGASVALKARGPSADVLAGLLLALTLFKFQFAIVVILILVAWLRWRVAVGFSMGAAGLAALSLAITGFAAPMAYAKSLLSMSARLSTSNQQYLYGINPSLMPNLRGALYGALHDISPNIVLQLATAIFSVLIVLWAIRGKKSFDLAILAAIICSYHCMIHDAIILLIPLVFISAPQESSTPTGSISFGWIRAGVFAAPTLLFLARAPYWPIGLLLVVFLFCVEARSSLGVLQN